MNTETLLTLPARQPPANLLPSSLHLTLAGMELVNLYIMGNLTLQQTNELLVANGHRRVLTIIEKRVR